MGDISHNAGPGGKRTSTHLDLGATQKPAVHAFVEASDPTSAAFHSQLDHLPQAQVHDAYSRYPPSFNMAAVAQNLPHSPHSPMSTQSHFGPGLISGEHPPQNMHQMPHQGYTSTGMDPAALARAQQMQQAQFMYSPYNAMPPAQQQMRQMQMPAQYNMAGYYVPYGNQRSPQVADSRFMRGPPPTGMPNMAGDFSQYAHRNSEPVTIPSFPRGPPRKPKQSGHALWVGNLPPAARIEDLKDHFSRDATKDIESLFLISKSNCAFVNYRSEQACSDAMARFHDSRFHGVRLVCRLRRATGSNSAAGTPTATTVEEEAEVEASEDSSIKRELSHPQDPEGPTIVGGSHIKSPTAEKSGAVVGSAQSARKVPERYFIVKSLTVQDLESSMRTGIWATQNHIESKLNDAYQNSENVYLVFSANKSGEYFGYARMASSIAGHPVNLNAEEEPNEASSEGAPHARETPATGTAPKGRIIDDSARGTIFWEAILSKEDDADRAEIEKDEEGFETTPGSNWGRQFNVEWISTTRVPFYRTRGLRNPWNSQREVKIARDGTELEPSIGRRVVSMFHGPSGSAGPSQQGVQYR